MAFALDPILSNILFTLNLSTHLHKSPSESAFESPMALTRVPMVSVLLAMYKEPDKAVERTVRSLEAQTYPPEKMEIIYLLEPDDQQTKIPTLSKPIKTTVVRTDGKSRLKAYALNKGLQVATGEIVVVYDADDQIDPDQIIKGVNLMEEKGYDVIQPRIIRKSSRLRIGPLFELDNFIWNKRFLPFFRLTLGCFPLSGEGLFNRRRVLDEVGGFPEVLTEDAYLALVLSEHRKKFGLLDSTVVEEQPKSTRGHFRQRVRWFRGYLTCLRKLVGAKLPLKTKILLSVAFLAPITCAASLISWIFLGIYWATWATMSPSFLAPWMNNAMYGNALIYWGVGLAYLGNVLIIFNTARAVMDTEYERLAASAALAPLYWLFLGLAAVASFFRGTKVFGRTER
jgi:cellulose synthase/poly-beta-1,6-N-acetylglucosamine synthase-like glycosyltransferase